jgi:hypothetical protein
MYLTDLDLRMGTDYLKCNITYVFIFSHGENCVAQSGQQLGYGHTTTELGFNSLWRAEIFLLAIMRWFMGANLCNSYQRPFPEGKVAKMQHYHLPPHNAKDYESQKLCYL